MHHLLVDASGSSLKDTGRGQLFWNIDVGLVLETGQLLIGVFGGFSKLVNCFFCKNICYKFLSQIIIT